MSFMLHVTGMTMRLTTDTSQVMSLPTRELALARLCQSRTEDGL
jgi:hypothetical protein